MSDYNAEEIFLIPDPPTSSVEEQLVCLDRDLNALEHNIKLHYPSYEPII